MSLLEGCSEQDSEVAQTQLGGEREWMVVANIPGLLNLGAALMG